MPDDNANVQIAPELYDNGARNGRESRQTFYVQAGFSDVVFAAPSARIVQTDKLLKEEPDGTVRVAGGNGSGFGKGAVYTVYSRSLPVTEANLRAADAHARPRRDRRAVRAAPRDDEPRARARPPDHRGVADRRTTRCEHSRAGSAPTRSTR